MLRTRNPIEEGGIVLRHLGWDIVSDETCPTILLGTFQVVFETGEIREQRVFICDLPDKENVRIIQAFEIGWSKLEQKIRDRMRLMDPDEMTPQTLIKRQTFVQTMLNRA